MQQPQPPNALFTQWINWLLSPALILGAIALFAKVVMWPAAKRVLREDLQPELEKVGKTEREVRELTIRMEATERVLASLSSVPVVLERIEANVENLTKLVERRGTSRVGE